MANTGGAIFSPYNMPRDFKMTPKNSMGLRHQTHLGHDGSWGTRRNYSAAVEQDAEIAEEIRELITRTEQQVNAKLSRVNDRGAFDTDELDCLFCRLGEALPNRAVLEQRAG